MRLRTLKSALGTMALAASLAPAANLASFSGHILGEVRNSAGIVQMGATVALYNRYDQEVRQVLTNEAGKFVFDALSPDLYSVRVTLASFMPALRRNIAVAAGSENLLKINLASVFSTVELIPAAATRGALMSDDWKWVLRASQATRPIFRFLPVAATSSSRTQAALFSDTTGLVRVSAADDGDMSQQGLGTSFAVSTRVKGSASVRVSGKFGYTTGAGLPAGALRTTYVRDSGAGPQVSLTVRQIYLPSLVGSGTPSGLDAGPALRAASLRLHDGVKVTDAVLLEYGVSLDSASYLTRVNAVSPYARLTYNLTEASVVRVAFSSGTQPESLLVNPREISSNELNQDLAALAMLPLLSRRDNQLRMELSDRWEAGYERVLGSRKVAVSAFREDIRNGTAILAGDNTNFGGSQAIPDFDSHNQIINIGDYQRNGIAAGISQSLGDHLEAAISTGEGGVLEARSHVIQVSDPSLVGGLLHKANRPWVTARLTTTVARTGTKIGTSYGWSDSNALIPTHLYLSSAVIQQDTGWNMSIRQPLPAFGGYKGRMEAALEGRNLLSDGYIFLVSGQKQNQLTSAPRSVRGSLSFIF
jgi:hypothetical protein